MSVLQEGAGWACCRRVLVGCAVGGCWLGVLQEGAGWACCRRVLVGLAVGGCAVVGTYIHSIYPSTPLLLPQGMVQEES